MRIACVKCSTVYELDDRLIPSAGALVQCTRCNSVFTAKPGAAPAPKPVAPATSSSAPTQPLPARPGTLVFGALKADEQISASSPRAGTQIFGSLPQRPPASARREAPGGGGATAAGSSVATRTSGGGAQALPSPRPTARGATAGREAGAAAGGTRIFGSLPSAPPRGTQIFGLPVVAGEPRSPQIGAPAPSARPPSAPTSSSASRSGELGNGAQDRVPEPQPSVDLPPEEPAWLPSRGQRRQAPVELPAAESFFQVDSAETADTAGQTEAGSRSRLAWVVLLIAAVSLPTFFAVRAVVRRRSAVPAEVVRAEENALTLLRRDDRRSRKQAIAEIESLAKSYPSLIGPAATRLLALSLDFDDVRLAAKRIQAQSDEISRRLFRLQDQRIAADWETQAALARSQLTSLTKEADPLIEEAKALDQQVAAAYSALAAVVASRGGADDPEAIRAQAVYHGVKGSERASPLAQRYRETGAKDGWDAVALAEYAANAPATAAVIAEARAENERTRSADSAFLRPYVLVARLALAQKDYDAASTLLDAVVALNPSHQLAHQLAGWVEDSRHSEAAKSAQAVGDPSGRRQ